MEENKFENLVLASLLPCDRQLIDPHLTKVALPFRFHLQQAFRKIEYVYFPESGIASVVAVSKTKRRQAEAAIIGFEGMTGSALVHATDRSPCDVFMQVAGEGQRIGIHHIVSAMESSKALRDRCGHFAHVLGVQTEHTALANAEGSIPERLARWLLMTHDRTRGNHITMTHDLISVMVGARRAGITRALGAFCEKGYISTTRGGITILIRDSLKAAADGLYGVPEDEHRRLFNCGAVEIRAAARS
jgi:CRP-like cAMP-binding protein